MNRRHMSGDHHGRTARRATPLVTAADEILGTHRLTRRYWPPGNGSSRTDWSKPKRPRYQHGVRKQREITRTNRVNRTAERVARLGVG
jgi:hypothetical protein